ncbi:hypothetical protein B296_00029949 [Ensete ventricosum]|uniref:Uncharacterized protein n=1 Tax=Ensete ventricosum TaxID=4639 RepID=A0A426ZH91_ENSVE|nr:hypothetical protein B296_00029949 [Ensete ventricosum]
MPPLWADAIPKGDASVGATPAGTSDARERLLLLAVALPLATATLRAAALAGDLGHVRPPLQGPSYGQPPCRALAVASHPCRWHGHSWLPLLITFTAKT